VAEGVGVRSAPVTASDPVPVIGRPGRAGTAFWVAVVLLVSPCWFAVHPWLLGASWHFLVLGARLLVGLAPGGGLHLYARHPDLQIGPLSFLVAVPFLALPADVGRVLAVAAMTVGGVGAVAVLARRSTGDRSRRWRRGVLAGAAAAPGWLELATRAGHLDDVLAILLGVAALTQRARHRSVPAGLLAAAAADAKPWALAFAPLLVDPDVPVRTQVRAAVGYGLLLAAAWLPFLLADHATVSAARFTIRDAPSSALRALGVTARRTPRWDRPAQVLLGSVAGLVATLRRRPGAVLLVAVAARILLDPSVFPYYTGGLLIAAAAFDLLETTWYAPVTTIAFVIAVYLPHYALYQGVVLHHGGSAAAGGLRAAVCLLAIAVALLTPTALLRPPAVSTD